MRKQSSGFNIFSTLSNSWKFFTNSLRFFSKNKDLVILPLISLITNSLFLLVSFAGFHSLTQKPNLGHSAIVYLIPILVFLLILAFITIFFNAALVACATERLQNKPGKLSDGFKHALRRAPQLLIWSVISAIVGGLIHALEKANSRLGEIVSAVLGFTWAASTYLVLPLIVMDQASAFSALKKGIKTFGRQFRRVISIYALVALMFFLFSAIVAIALKLFPVLAFSKLSPLMIEVIIVIAAILIATFWMVASSVNAVVQSALYLRIIKKETPTSFDNTLLDSTYISR